MSRIIRQNDSSRRWSSVWLVILLAGMLTVFADPRPAQAFVAPSVPVIASVAVGAPAVVPATIGLVGLGLWYAWSKRDTIRSWFDSRPGITKGSIKDTHPALLMVEFPQPATLNVANNTATFTFQRVTSTSINIAGRCYTPSAVAGDPGTLGNYVQVFFGFIGGTSAPAGTRVSVSFGGVCAAPAMLAGVVARQNTNHDNIFNHWYPPIPEDARREMRTTVSCRDRDGNLIMHSVTQNITAFDDRKSTATIPACGSIIPDSHQEKVVVEDRKAGTAEPFQPIITQEIPANQNTATAPYADCLFLSGGTPCLLRVQKDGVDCVAGASCADWYDKSATQPGFACKWGTYTMTLEECLALRYNYNTGTGVGEAIEEEPGVGTAPKAQPSTTTKTNPDGSTTTTQTEVLPDGNTRIITRTTAPDGSVTTRTVVKKPSGEVVSDSTVVGSPFGSGETVDPDGKNCISGAFSFNPLNWVYVPVKCALKWAFVPDTAVVTSWQNRIDGLKTRPPLSLGIQGSEIIAAERDAIGSASCAIDDAPVTLIGGTTVGFDPICAIGGPIQNTGTGQVIYKIFQAGAYIGLGFFIWLRVFRSVGSKEITGADDDN